MRAIIKRAEPPSLTAQRLVPHSDYDNYVAKGDLRHALIAEQRGLCCYCMGRIVNGPTSMRIEHWRCKANYPDDQLSYRNLLGACLGGQGQPGHLQHCDTRKGDRALSWNPANPVHHIESRVQYQLDGSIWADDPVFDDQLNDVLNLNLPLLKNNRKRLLDAVLDWWKREKAEIRGKVPRERFVRERDTRRGGTDELAPYCQVAVWWLEQKIARMEA